MLSSAHFYHRITRKLVVAFGTIFNNMKLYRYNKAGTIEIERINIPLSYSAKEKFIQKITQDPLLTKEVQITLPRMSFEMISITYDPLRKISSFNDQFAANNSTQIKRVTSAPYNFDFNLNIYVRNTEDGTQIIEQILPYFSPDYTVTINLVGISALKVDVPIILQSVSQDVESTGSTEASTRMIVWTLSFTAKAYLYGPIADSKVIRTVSANTYYDNAENFIGERIITVGAGNGNYKIGELIYEGRTVSSANATGFVESWDSTSNTLTIIETNGVLATGKYIIGAVTNSSHVIVSTKVNDYQLTNLTITASSNTANVDTAFGFTETLEESPNIT